DALVDEAADGRDLGLLLVVGGVEDELEAVLLRERRLERLGVGGAPTRLGAGLREADGDEVVAAPAPASASAVTALCSAAGHRESNGSHECHARQDLLHEQNLLVLRVRRSSPAPGGGCLLARRSQRGEPSAEC